MRKSEIRRVMAVIGKRGAKAAKRKRIETMTLEQRSERARRMANARWHPPVADSKPAADTAEV
jgi:hypothetical protein